MRKSPARVVVIGGGVIGTACAHYLSLDGRDVTVIERGESGKGTSFGNCGLVCPSHVLPLAEPGAVGKSLKLLFARNSPFTVRPRLDPSLWSWLLHFAWRCNETAMLDAARGIQPLLEASLHEYSLIIEEEGLDCEWHRNGLLFAYRSSEAMDAYGQTDRLLGETFQCPARRLDADELIELEPALNPGLAGGWYYGDDAHLRPDKLMNSWRGALATRGVKFLNPREFLGFRGENGVVHALETSAGDVEADSVVVATGALTPRLNEHLGARVPIQPGKGYSLTMPKPAVCPSIPMIFPETRVAATPFESGFRLGSTMEFAGYDETVRPARIQLLRDGAAPYLREPYTDIVENQWFGWRPMTYDSLPIIDRSPAWSNVTIATGHNMLGLSMAPATGKLIASMVASETPFLDLSPYRLARFSRSG